MVTVDRSVVFDDRRDMFEGIDDDWPREEIFIVLRKTNRIRNVNRGNFTQNPSVLSARSQMQDRVLREKLQTWISLDSESAQIFF